MYRTGTFTIAVFAACTALLQSAFADLINFYGVVPDLLFILTAFFALYGCENEWAKAAFCCGFFKDIVSPFAFGSYIASFLFMAFFLNRLLAPSPSGVLAPLFYYMAQVNIMLAAFNLIPIPPLDGSKILIGLTTGSLRSFLVGLERYGFFIVIGLLYLGVLDPLIAFFRWMILTLIRFFLP